MPSNLMPTDSIGNLVSASTLPPGAPTVAIFSVAFDYDDVGRMLTQTSTLDGSAVTLASTYDLAGNRTTLADSFTGLATFGYDGAGRMSRPPAR